MNISWFEIVAQIINFFIILFILQKLLYKPVMNAMKKRQEAISKSRIEADEKMQNAEELINEYDEKIAKIQDEKRDILDDARKQADEKKESLLTQYKEEAESKRSAYLKEIDDEKENVKKKLKKNLGSSAVKIASHILDNISSKELEEEIFNTFKSNLEDLSSKLTDFDALKEENVVIHSFRDLSENEKNTIENVLRNQMKNLRNIEFETDPELILGYEINLETYTVHTSIRKYLSEIEKEIIKDLDTN
jgi:alternate F1F0 ATPase F0 subunit B